MKNTHRLFLTSALAAVLMVANAAPAAAEACHVTNFAENYGAINTGTMNLQREMVGSFSAMAEQNNSQNLQMRAEGEAKKAETEADKYQAAEEEKARQAGKEYNDLVEEHAPNPLADCVKVTADMVSDYERVALRNDVNLLTKNQTDMLRNGASGGANVVQLNFFKAEQEARGSSRAAEYSPSIASARNDCTTPQCFNTALKNMVLRAQAMGASDRAPYRAKLNKELTEYFKQRGVWETNQAKAMLELENTLPLMFTSLANYNDAVGYFKELYNGDEAQAKKVIHARWPNSGAIGMSEHEKNQALLMTQVRQGGIRGNQMNNAQLTRFGTSLNELKARVQEGEAIIARFNDNLRVVSTPAPAVSAGAVSVQ